MVKKLVLSVLLMSPLVFGHQVSTESVTDSSAENLTANLTEKNATTSAVIKPFTATYSILHKSKPVGTGTRTFEYLPDGKGKYSYSTDIEWLIFSDKRSETSIFYLDDGKVTPYHYIFEREGTGKDKYYEWQYDIENNIAKDIDRKRTKKVNFPVNIQDKLSYHFQNRLHLIAHPKQEHFVYPVISTSGSIKNTVYQYDGEEDLMLPYGVVKTIRLKREVIDKERITYAWFAPELNYLLVKLYQIKGNVEQFEAQLTAVEVND
ncbi:DUF3108 domain-containing protein [Colwellia sp. MEBiC06753]